MLCQDCPKRESCAELCAKAERYVGQDEKKYQRERTYGSSVVLDILGYRSRHNWQDCSTYWIAQSVNFSELTPTQNKCLHLFYFEGLSYKQIAFRLSGNRKGAYSCDNIDYCIRSAKRRILRFSSKSEGGIYMGRCKNRQELRAGIVAFFVYMSVTC